MRAARPGLLLVCLALSACSLVEPQRPESVVDLAARTAEQNLLGGIRQYEEGNYAEAETRLNAALSGQLIYSKDEVYAYKYLAFIDCGSNRIAECTEAFKHALAIDPKFELSARESGHPIWGPLFKSLQADAATAAAAAARR